MKTFHAFSFIVAFCATLGLAPTFAQDFAQGQLTPDRDVANPQSAWWDDAWWERGQLPQVQNHKVVERAVSYMNGDIEVPAVVLRPDDDKQYPAVLFQHGRAGWMDLIKGHARRLAARGFRSEEHTSELQSHHDLVCRLLLEKKKKKNNENTRHESYRHKFNKTNKIMS